jgi:hypothetical protein
VRGFERRSVFYREQGSSTYDKPAYTIAAVLADAPYAAVFT